MPNVPPAKQLPPVTVLNRAALPLSLSLLFIAVLSRLSLCLFSKRRFALVLFFLCLLLSSLPLRLLIFIFSSKSAWTHFLLWPCPFYHCPLLSSPSFILFPVFPSFSSCSLSFTSFSWCVASLSLFAFSQGKLEKDKGHKEYNPINICRQKENRWNSETVRWVLSSESLIRATFVQCKSCSLKSVNLEKRLCLRCTGRTQTSTCFTVQPVFTPWRFPLFLFSAFIELFFAPKCQTFSHPGSSVFSGIGSTKQAMLSFWNAAFYKCSFSLLFVLTKTVKWHISWKSVLPGTCHHVHVTW